MGGGGGGGGGSANATTCVVRTGWCEPAGQGVRAVLFPAAALEDQEMEMPEPVVSSVQAAVTAAAAALQVVD